MSINEYYKNFGIVPIKDRKALDDQLLYNIYKKPQKEKGDNLPVIAPEEPGLIQQADLLFMPTDKGYKYALVVVDVGSRLTDAVPLKTKNTKEVTKAFETIYKRGILKIPERLEVDSGSEFKGELKEYFKNNDVFIRYGKPTRHRQQALVERRNQQLGKALFTRQVGQELLDKEENRQWIEDLPVVIKSLNAYYTDKPKTKLRSNEPTGTGTTLDILPEGTKVRALLDEPINVATGKAFHGHHRSTDVYWNPQERVIKQIILRGGQPPMYLLDGKVGHNKIDPVAYTKGQLQVIPKNEKLPPASILRKIK